MRRRYELHPRLWKKIEPLLPHPTHHGGPGRPWHDHYTILNGILWMLHSGAPWRDLPERYGPWQTVYDRFNRWRKDGTWARLVTWLLDHLQRRGCLGRDLWCVDASIIRASHAAAGAKKNPGRARVLAGPKAAQLQEPPSHALGYSQGGFGTKVHLVCEDHGILLGIYVTPGQRHESQFFETVIERVLVPHRRGQRYWPERMAGDKGYSYRHIRRWLKRHGTRGVIPTRKNQPRDLGFEKAQYRRRNIVERAIGWYKECRHLATRYDKLAVNYVAFWLVAMMERDLRFLGLSDTD